VLPGSCRCPLGLFCTPVTLIAACLTPLSSPSSPVAHHIMVQHSQKHAALTGRMPVWAGSHYETKQNRNTQKISDSGRLNC